VIFTFTLAILAVYAYSVMNSVKVGGPLYDQITQAMNIRADILPPPQYPIETELTTLQMAHDALAGLYRSLLFQRTDNLLNLL
jgi:methyl-accepting chemotaxis protein